MSLEPEKIEKQYYSIGEVADILGENPSLIRFWESKFNMLSPRKNRKGNRAFTRDDIELLKDIHFLVKVKKYTLEGAEEKIKKDRKSVNANQKTRETLLGLKSFLGELREAL